MVAARPAEILVLGPLQVVTGDRRVELGATARSALLARLAVARGGAVTVAQLAEDVWGSDPAETDGTVRVTIKRLRDLMGAPAIARRPGGYALDLDHVALDLLRLERLTSTSSNGSAAASRAALEEALTLFRGAPFAGLSIYPFLGPEIERLQAVRDRLADERFRLLLDAGAGAELVGELEDAWHERPHNEYRCGALMTALYRAGRQVDALSVLRRTTEQLRDDLGLSPGPHLRRIERQVLRQDPALLGPAFAVESASPASGDVDAMVSSARALAGVGAWEPSLRIARQALSQARSLSEPRLICRALLMTAQAGFMSGEHDPTADPAASWAALDEATAIARRQRDGGLLARAAITRFGCGIGPADDHLLVAITEPLDYLPRKSVERIDLLCAATATAIFGDAGPTADRLFREIEHSVPDGHDARVEVMRLTAACVIGARRDMPVTELDRRSSQAVALARSTDDLLVLAAALQARLLALTLAGDFDGLDRLAPEIEQTGRAGLVPFAVQRSRLLRHALALVRGQLGGLVAEILETIEIGRRIGAVATDAPAAQLTYTLLEQADYGVMVGLLPAGGDADPSGLVDIARALAGAELAEAPHDPDVQREVAAVLSRLGSLPSHQVSPFTAALASELAWWTSSVPLATWAGHHLGPAQGRMVTIGLGTLIAGPDELFAGLTRQVLGDADEAIRLLESALARLERTTAAALAARTRIYLAHAYRRRDGPGDAGRVDALEGAARPNVPRLDSLSRRAHHADVGVS